MNIKFVCYENIDCFVMNIKIVFACYVLLVMNIKFVLFVMNINIVYEYKVCLL